MAQEKISFIKIKIKAIKDKINNEKIFFISLALFLLSLTQTAFYANNSRGLYEESQSVWVALLWGWVKVSGAGISWLANPLLFFSWIILLITKDRITETSLLISFLAMLFACSFIFTKNININVGLMPEYDLEITKYGAGYWLWFLSCAVNLIGHFTLFLRPRKPI